MIHFRCFFIPCSLQIPKIPFLSLARTAIFSGFRRKIGFLQYRINKGRWILTAAGGAYDYRLPVFFQNVHERMKKSKVFGNFLLSPGQ
jgi:hypothetical protein